MCARALFHTGNDVAAFKQVSLSCLSVAYQCFHLLTIYRYRHRLGQLEHVLLLAGLPPPSPAGVSLLRRVVRTALFDVGVDVVVLCLSVVSSFLDDYVRKEVIANSTSRCWLPTRAADRTMT